MSKNGSSSFSRFKLAFEAFIALLTAFGGWVAFYAPPAGLENVIPWYEQIKRPMIVLCAAVTTVSLVVCVAATAGGFLAVTPGLPRRDGRNRWPHFKTRASDSKTLVRYDAAIEDLLERSLGGDRPVAALSPQRLREHHAVNPGCMLLVWEVDDGERTLQGLLVLVALTDAAIDMLDDGRITSGHQIGTDLVLPDFRQCRAVYMMGIYAPPNRMLGGMLLMKTEDRFAQLRKENPRLRSVYARGSTPPGRLVLKNNGFQEIRPGSGDRMHLRRLA